MSALREYLAGQAELGLDEVVLPRPLARAPAKAEKRAPAGPEKPAASAAAAASAAPADPDVESPVSLGHLLESVAHAAIGTADAASALGSAARSQPLPTLPDFKDFAAFWSHAEKTFGSEGKILRGVGPLAPALALVSLQASDDEAAAGCLLQGGAAALLEKMMRAIRLELADLYVTCLVKTTVRKAWSRREMGRMLPWLHGELGLALAPVSLLLGEACAQAVLRTGKPLDELRQTLHVVEGRQFAATYHPEDLLRDEELKRKAWQDLKWLDTRLRTRDA